MFLATTHRPRNVDAPRAAALLYGDLGTSKAYVIGLAFALSGYASFWLIAAVSLLTLLIGINYITICNYYPNGGGVYASVRHRSPLISMMGAFFIIADYLVTAALSAVAAITYLGVSDPIFYAALAIGVIGLLNFFGPRHTGSLAFIIALFTFIVLTLLALIAIPHLPEAWHHIEPLKGDPGQLWNNFVGVIVALSGIEAIANTTGVMTLDPRTTMGAPKVGKTAKKAILIVIIEVTIYTSFFAFAANALSDFTVTNGTVDAPGNPNVRDYMLKYLGESFAGNLLGPEVGYWFGLTIALAMSILLLSAVNTAISALVSLLYLMAHDQELPSSFQKINSFGVPIYPLLLATLIPVVLVVTVGDLAHLAALYAIGFVGAIATNLGSTSTDFSLNLKKKERLFMFLSFLIMAAIEITIFIEKPHARYYALGVIFVGLLLRGLSRKSKKGKPLARGDGPMQTIRAQHTPEVSAILCVIYNKRTQSLESARKRASASNSPLYLLFIREQRVLAEKDLSRDWQADPEATALFDSSKEGITHCYYCVSDATANRVLLYAQTLGAKQIFIHIPRRRFLLLRELKKILPDDFILYS